MFGFLLLAGKGSQVLHIVTCVSVRMFASMAVYSCVSISLCARSMYVPQYVHQLQKGNELTNSERFNNDMSVKELSFPLSRFTYKASRDWLTPSR